jgi:hypothetical protein
MAADPADLPWKKLVVLAGLPAGLPVELPLV